jgi:hypothetical protein
MKVYKECCKNCLLSPDAIVSNKRRKEIIQGCVQEQTHFICHKASMRGEDVCCKTYYDTLGQHSQMVRIAQRLGMVEIIEQPKSEKLPTYREMSDGEK